MNKKTVKDVELNGKKVLVRVDFNVPMKDGKITNDNRIVAALPTIKYILENGGRAILFSHLGKIKSEEDKASKSLRPAAERLAELLGQDVKFIPQTRGAELEAAITELKDGEVLMFENTRFEDLDGKKESKNDAELGKYWASLGDVFVNDAFGTAHRAHASNVGISANLEAVAGFLLEKEIEFIGGAVDAPQRPMVAILGGAKVSDKIGVIENLLDKADKVLVGGGMMFTFLKAQGKNIGKSLCEEDKLELAKALLEKGGDKLVLPIDTVAAKEFSNDTEFRVVSVDELADDEMGLDVGPATVELFSNVLKDAKTVVWNGPMGVFEMSNFAKGTIGVCEAIANLEGAITIIGGGDSAAAAMQLGYADKFSHISTGGGASLEYLEGKELPGVASLSNKCCGCGCK
ncbi:MAG: phosphoglycerate kinase [Turicibacter sanguinis]|uniref:phosphoglycerate kinase n=1 Tax=Turicibacter sanguinis TaxID=154288 RepID=UPI003991A9E4